ncbi:NAD-dependent epimerase/dehydratase family protein [Neolewinella litorea]|uniref:NAD-dependent epimerase/dehydratase family protein n=1 Tax=Neolewinella litorea TaxID=2562452 RepID=A0A4S4NFZ7_9BACT|nr:NAD-dependent epimerase/dehydratase family protein [Neolewinella litorea]THH37557.1 NAD-dependent epimerase/dehydratase family protein [Neolewinella litorea]
MLPTVLITGANGQLGTVLVPVLRERYGHDNVIATDIRPPLAGATGRFSLLDATDEESLRQLVRGEGVTQIYHLGAILSANGELNPLHTWRVNMDSLLNVLEVSRTEGVERVFYPSSIAVFGHHADLSCTPNHSVLNPTTVYGISKAAGENWAQYYFERYGLDVRSLRYPGIIGHQSAPGGGTTDYAVEIFHSAAAGQPYSCFLQSDTTLPMIYMDDAIRATLELMEAPTASIKVRTSYNLSGCSFSPADVAEAIQKILPDFEVRYAPDFRQNIAADWPDRIDDGPARNDWGWKPAYDLDRICATMLDNLLQRAEANSEVKD